MRFVLVSLLTLVTFPAHGRDLENENNLFTGPHADLGDALTARAHDASASYYNPAGLVFTPQQSMSFSSTTLGRFNYTADYAFDDQTYSAQFDKRPFFTSYSYRDPHFAPDFAFGFAVMESQNAKNDNRSSFTGVLPNGSATGMPYDIETFYSSELSHTQVTAATAYRLTSTASIGASVTYGILNRKMSSSTSSSVGPFDTGHSSWEGAQQNFSKQSAKADSFGAQVGTEVTLNDWLKLGSVYRTFSILNQTSDIEFRSVQMNKTTDDTLDTSPEGLEKSSASSAYPFSYRKHALQLGLSFGDDEDFANIDLTAVSAAHNTQEEKYAQLDIGFGAQKRIHRWFSMTSGFRTYFDDGVPLSLHGRQPTKTDYLDMYTGALGLLVHQASFSMALTYTRAWGRGQLQNNPDQPLGKHTVRGQSVNISISSY